MDIRNLMRRLHGILDAHWGYSALIYFSGAGKGRRVFIKERSGIKMGDRILEIGCGPGTNIEYMPEKVTYTGCDYNPDYIDSANKRYAGRGTFLCLSVDDLPAKNLGEFDVALVVSVLHHLDDNQVRILAQGAHRVLRNGGVFLVWEPCWTDGQSWLDRFMLSIDRGRYVRRTEEYVSLLRETFKDVASEFFMTPGIIWPQSGCILKATKTTSS
jgi:SAM-dependent methyltransferase